MDLVALLDLTDLVAPLDLMDLVALLDLVLTLMFSPVQVDLTDLVALLDLMDQPVECLVLEVSFHHQVLQCCPLEALVTCHQIPALLQETHPPTRTLPTSSHTQHSPPWDPHDSCQEVSPVVLGPSLSSSCSTQMAA